MSWGNSTVEIVLVAWKYQDPGKQISINTLSKKWNHNTCTKKVGGFL